MYSFCISIPYAFLLAGGGAVGYLKAGSLPSLIAGAGSGGILAILGYGELNQFKTSGRVSNVWTILSLVVSGALTVAMGARCKAAGGAIMPAMIAATSLAASLFYVYRLLTPVKPKHAKE